MPGMEIIMKKIRKLVTVTFTLSLAFFSGCLRIREFFK